MKAVNVKPYLVDVCLKGPRISEGEWRSVILEEVVPNTCTVRTRNHTKRVRRKLLAKKPPNGRSCDGYSDDFRGNGLKSLACYVFHDRKVSSRVPEDIVDLGDTGSRVVLLGEVVEVGLGFGLDENVLVIAVLDELSVFAWRTEDEMVGVVNIG